MGLSDHYTFKVEVAFDAGPLTYSATWTDVTSDVLAGQGVTFATGARSVGAKPGPGLADLVMKNWAEGSKVAGRWTPGVTASPWHPLELKRRIRISCTPTATSTERPLWGGHITDHTPGWVGAGKATCALSCSDILAATGRIRPYDQTGVMAEQAADGPRAMYPLDESEGTTTAGDRSTRRNPVLEVAQLGTDGTLDFGTGSFGIEEQTCPVFTRADDSNGKYLAATFTSPLFTGPTGTVEVYAQAGSTAEYLGILGLHDDAGNWIGLGTAAGGVPVVKGGADDPTGVTASAIAVGEWHHYAIAMSYSAGTTTLTFYVDGVSAGTTTAPFSPTLLRTLWVGRDLNIGSTFDGQMAAVAVYDYANALDTTQISDHAAAMNGWPTEVGATRFARLVRHAGIDSGLTANSSGSIMTTPLGPQMLKGTTLPRALDTIAVAVGGSVYAEAGGGVTTGRLVIADAEFRYTLSTLAAVTLDARTDVLDRLDGLAYNDDDLTNDVTVSRPGGATVRAVNAESVAEFGSLTDDAEAACVDDDAAQYVAEGLANRRAWPAIKAPTLRVSMLAIATASPSQIDGMMQLARGQRITVTNLPAGLPTTTLDLFVEGISDEVGPNDWVRTITTSSLIRGGAAWVLGDSDLSVLGSTTILA